MILANQIKRTEPVLTSDCHAVAEGSKNAAFRKHFRTSSLAPATPVESLIPVLMVPEAQGQTEVEIAANIPKEGIEIPINLQTPAADPLQLEPAAVTIATQVTPKDNDTTTEGVHLGEEEEKWKRKLAIGECCLGVCIHKYRRWAGKPKSCLVVLKNLPKQDLDFTFVQSLIHGGSIESMTLSRDKGVAYIKFTEVEDGWRYLLSHEGGIKFKHNGQDSTITVEDGKDYSETEATIQAYIECGATRVIRLQHVSPDLPPRILLGAAGGTHGEREVEYMAESFRGGMRTVVFRFTCITDAVMFRKSLLATPQAWRAQNVQFIEDPCALRTAIDAKELA